MDGEARRREVLKVLQASDVAVNATKLARKFAVSRQIIVGDIALLRAVGKEIVATSRGYFLSENEFSQAYTGKIACDHEFAETEKELNLIVELGGEVVDVIVEHPVYGEISGNLRIKTKREVTDFMKQICGGTGSLLSAVTGGVHLHTIACEDEKTFQQIQNVLSKNNLLYQKS